MLLLCSLSLFLVVKTASSHGVGAWTGLQPAGIPPPSKVYHSSATVGSNLYISGGAAGKAGGNRTVYYDSFQNKWVNQANAELPHDAQVADMDESGGVLYLFGGKDTVHIDPDGAGLINSMHILRTVTSRQTWETVHPLHSPGERNGHTMTSIAGMMVVFGGWDQTKYYNDLYGLDTTELVLPSQGGRPIMWMKLTPESGSPAPRNSHTMVSVGHELIMFGGFSHNIEKSGAWTQCPPEDKCIFYDDVWSLRLPSKIDQGDVEWKQLAPTDEHRPVGRWWHAASAVGDRMYVYGGLSSTGVVLSDVWSYSPSVNVWRVLAANPMGGSYGHSMSVMAGSLYIFGGFTKPAWAGRTSQLWRYDTPLVESDDDGEELIPTTNPTTQPSSAAGVTIGFLLTITLNLVILGLNVYACRKNGGGGGGGGGGGYVNMGGSV